MTFERTEVAQGHLRTINLSIVTASLSSIGALLISTNAQDLGQAVVLGVGLAAGLVAVRRWESDRITHVVLPCLLVAAAVWLYGILVLDDASASFGLSVVSTVLVLRLPPQHRRAAALGLAGLIVGMVVVKMALSPESALQALVEYAVGSLSVAVVGVVFASLNYVVAGLIGELERARERDAELAVARERVRFAGDLHDIQGHTLHVVKLKVALARKLVHSDTDQVERELEEVYELVGDTIAETKELAYAQRRLNLSAELENAKNLFEAAGISVSIDRDPPDAGSSTEVAGNGDGTETEGRGRSGIGARADAGAGTGAAAAELLGQVLRETTTNILRHAQAGQVRITLSGAGITIVNDGAQEGPAPELSGLSALRERVERDGGTLRIEREDGRFLTAATFPQRKDDR